MKKRIVKKIFDKVFYYYWIKFLRKSIKKEQKKDNLFLNKFSKYQNQYLKLDKNKFVKFSIFFDESKIYFKK